MIPGLTYGRQGAGVGSSLSRSTRWAVTAHNHHTLLRSILPSPLTLLPACLTTNFPHQREGGGRVRGEWRERGEERKGREERDDMEVAGTV